MFKVTQTVTVPFSLGGSAVSGVAYSGVTPSPLTFGIGITSLNITGTLLPDAGLDPDADIHPGRTELREATDRLLRAGARTRIELERLEARAPLPTRDKIGQTAPLFRHR